jgi:beta-N-acetylhexosaminidase
MLLSAVAPVPAKDKDLYQRPAAVHLDREGEKWAEKTLKKLSLEEKIGQMLMVWAKVEFLNLNNPEYQRLREVMQKYHLGGFGLTVPVQSGLVVKSEPYEAAALVNQLQREARVPLIFAADFERGVAMRLNGTTVFPHAMAFGAAGKLEYAEQFGRITALEARAIGVAWNWFPDADVNSNPLNPIINTRSFGSDPQQVSALVSAYIRGARAAGMLTTAKHFPGHGDTDSDSHLGLARVGGDWQRLQAVELPPFRAAIAAGVDAVMIAHVTVPGVEPDPNLVASNSEKVIRGLLQNQLGFKGLIVTDALDMNALMRLFATARAPGATMANPSGAAAVAAVKAGSDMVIIPADLDGAYNGLLQAVRSGEIPEAQINTSVLKILRAKASVGLHKSPLVKLDELPKVIARPENLMLAQQVADAAVTLVRDNGKTLPFAAAAKRNEAATPYTHSVETRNRVVAVVFTDDVRSEWGGVLERQLRARVPDANVIYVDANSAAFAAEPILAMVAQAERVLAAIYVVPQAGKRVLVNGQLKNTVSLVGAQASLLDQILKRAGERTAVVSLGNPYVAADFPAVQTYLCTFSNAQVSEMAAIKALFGEMPIRGQLPVNIPGVAARGEGIQRAQSAARREAQAYFRPAENLRTY